MLAQLCHACTSVSRLQARHAEYVAEHGREMSQEEAEAKADAEFKVSSSAVFWRC